MTVTSGTRAVMIAAAAAALTLLGTTGPAGAATAGGAGPTTAAGPALVAPDGTVIRPTFVPGLGSGSGARPGGAAVNGTCAINGTTPTVTATGMDGRVYFSGTFQCNVAGIVEITVAALQADLGGAWHSQKMAGPSTSSSLSSPGIVGQGVTTDPTPCPSIGIAPWRGAIHPRLTTTAGVYDWGWYANAQVYLSC